MFDLHLHIPQAPSTMPDDWQGLVCTSHTKEWPLLLDALQRDHRRTGAIGILPNEIEGKKNTQILADMAVLLEKDRDLQIGEIGLDRRFLDTMGLEWQLDFLVQALGIANNLDRSVSLHVVGESEPLLQVLEMTKSRMGGRLPRMLWHGYTASVEIARRFIALGGTISLGPSVWRPGLKLAEHLKELRDIPFAMETDWPDGWLPEQWRGLTYQDILEEHLKRLSTAMDIPVDRLEERTHAIGTLFTHQSASR